MADIELDGGAIRLLEGDVRERLRELPAESVQTCVTSPPYWGLRDYKVDGQLGLEPTLEEYVGAMVEVFCEVRRVLRKDGCVFLNLGDSYASTGGYRDYGSSDNGTGRAFNSGRRGSGDGLKPKDLIGIPWRVAFALQQPYYTGSIRDERDRIWLAAMLDGIELNPDYNAIAERRIERAIKERDYGVGPAREIARGQTTCL